MLGVALDKKLCHERR